MLLLPCIAGAEQYIIFSQQCAAGNEEAVKLFKEAQDKRFGRGMTVDLEEGIKLYNQAAEKGSIRALYDLGTLYEQRPIKDLNAQEQEKVILDYYTRAAAAGCPEGTYKLHLWAERQATGKATDQATGQAANHAANQADNSGQGSSTSLGALANFQDKQLPGNQGGNQGNQATDQATGQATGQAANQAANQAGNHGGNHGGNQAGNLLVEAANKGALVAMFELGREFIRKGETKEGAAWMLRALDLGYGDAAEPLSRMAFEQKNMREGVALLRQGASLGSIACLRRLAWIYSRGQYNQMRDPEYAQCFTKIIESINPDAPPEVVPDFDELCPARRVFTY